jgi:LPXTG-motif cell wall-anchored protein
MGGSDSGQAAMTVVWVLLALAAVGGAGVYVLVRRRRGRRS